MRRTWGNIDVGLGASHPPLDSTVPTNSAYTQGRDSNGGGRRSSFVGAAPDQQCVSHRGGLRGTMTGSMSGYGGLRGTMTGSMSDFMERAMSGFGATGNSSAALGRTGKMLRTLPAIAPDRLEGVTKTPRACVKWRKCGQRRPSKGAELTNVALAAALLRKTEFSREEWERFGIKGLRMGDFIKAGNEYFQTVPGGALDVRLLGVSYPEFEDWFMSKDGFKGSLRPEIARAAWDRAAQKAQVQANEKDSKIARLLRGGDALNFMGVQPSWYQLRKEIDGAPLPSGDYPNWCVHFYICLRRYLLKLLRRRTRVLTLVVIMLGLGVICGLLHGNPPQRNDLITYYMLFNTLFAVVCATATSSTFVSGNGFFRHEAISGVRQSAEGLARMLADVLWLALLPLVFIQTIRAFAVLRMELYATWYMTAWAVSPLGYLFSIISPGNANVITATVVVLFFNVGNGFFGIKASSASALGLLPLLQMSPGFNAFLLVCFGACVAEPFDTTRWFMMRQLRQTGMIPHDVEGIYAYETGASPWRSDALLRLALFGLVVRAIVLVAFVAQSHVSFKGKMSSLETRFLDCCTCYNREPTYGLVDDDDPDAPLLHPVRPNGLASVDDLDDISARGLPEEIESQTPITSLRSPISSNRLEVGQADAVDNLLPGWRAIDQDGQTFYYNDSTGVSQWEAPLRDAHGRKWLAQQEPPSNHALRHAQI